MKIKILLIGVLLTNLFFTVDSVFARAGGGGSSSGGDDGGGGVIGFAIAMIFAIIAYYKRKKRIEKANLDLKKAAETDKTWDLENLKNMVTQLFPKFQKDWSNYDVESMKSYLTDDYYKRMLLEMNVLKNQKRQNDSSGLILKKINFFGVEDHENNEKDGFIIELQASGLDILQNTDLKKIIYTDSEPFNEYWHFVRVGNEWKLNLITQGTEDVSKTNEGMIVFAKKYGFYFDPDFGWLMMPDKGAIFRKTNFKISDINNHIIGYYRNKIVEFYSYIPNPRNEYGKKYVVAQAILPFSYEDILIKKKKRFFNFAPRGLRRIELESNDFNNKFCLFASPKDSVSSLVLLTPDFMEKIYDLPFDLNIEIVGSTLYFYVKNKSIAHIGWYEEMLKILSWAFDKMDN